MKTAKDKFMILKGRVVLAVLMILCSVEFVSAAGNGLSGINEATTMVTSPPLMQVGVCFILFQ